MGQKQHLLMLCQICCWLYGQIFEPENHWGRWNTSIIFTVPVPNQWQQLDSPEPCFILRIIKNFKPVFQTLKYLFSKPLFLKIFQLTDNVESAQLGSIRTTYSNRRNCIEPNGGHGQSSKTKQNPKLWINRTLQQIFRNFSEMSLLSASLESTSLSPRSESD